MSVAAIQPNHTADPRSPDFFFNPYAPEFMESPYALYRQMREHRPLHRYRTASGTEWILTRFVDIKRVLTDSDFVVENLPQRVPQPCRHMQASHDDLESLRSSLRPWLFSLDPPDHGRLRKLISADFTSTALRDVEPFIESVVAERLAVLHRGEPIDLMDAVARPLPIIVAAHMLGLPVHDLSRLLHCAESLFGIFEQPITYSRFERMTDAAKFFHDYISEEVARRRAGPPRKDLLGKLIRHSGTVLSEEELISFSAMLFAVGQETTENYIGNSVAALMDHPLQMERLRAHPDLLDNAVRELARYDSAVQFISRVAGKPVRLHGQEIAAGDRVYLALGSANRDDREYTNPDVLDVGRDHITNLPFGTGIHFCLGNALAKLQLRAVLAELTKFPGLELAAGDPAPARRKTVVIRGYTRLPLVCAGSTTQRRTDMF